MKNYYVPFRILLSCLCFFLVYKYVYLQTLFSSLSLPAPCSLVNAMGFYQVSLKALKLILLAKTFLRHCLKQGMAGLDALYLFVFSLQGRVSGPLVEGGKEGPDIFLYTIVLKCQGPWANIDRAIHLTVHCAFMVSMGFKPRLVHPSKSICWVSVACWVSEIWRLCYWTTRSYLPEGNLSTDLGELWGHIRWGLLLHAFYFWLFTFFSELNIQCLLLLHFSFLSSTLPQTWRQLCYSFNWPLNLTFM